MPVVARAKERKSEIRRRSMYHNVSKLKSRSYPRKHSSGCSINESFNLVFIIALSSQARGFRSHGGSRSSWAAGGKVVDSWPLGPGVWPPSIMMGYDVTMAVISGSSAKNDALLMNVLIFFGIISFKMYAVYYNFCHS